MADSTLIINTDNITTFEDLTQNSITDLNSTITEIVDKVNDFMDTATGHSHDGTDSKSLSSGVSGLTVEELALAQFAGISIYS